MPVTAPTSSAMVTTRIARLRLIFQLVMRFGRIAGNINLVKYCTVVGRNERIMPRSSLDTPRMASSESTRKTGPQTAISTKAIRNSTPRNHSTANRIQDTTGTAMNSRMMGWRYRSRFSDRYIAIARTRPRTNDRISAPMTRATVTTTSMGVIVIMLCAIRTKLGIAKAGMPSAGAKYDSTSQTTTKIRSERRVWPENFPSRPASRYSLRRIDDLVVGHLLIEPGLHRTFHHVHDRFAGGGFPRRLHDHVETLAIHRGLENPRRQLDGIDGDLVSRIGLFVKNVRHVLKAASSILGPAGMRWIASVRIAGTISHPSCPVISFQPSAPLKITFQLGFCFRMMLASGSMTRAASTRSASSCARATAKLALTTVISLPSSMPFALA